MQWGYAQKPTSEYDFYWVYPIPFPTLVGAIMLTPQYEGQCRVHSINSFDRFSCSFRTDGTRTDLNSNHVFAIGFQQWGVYTTGTCNVTITLPIATSVTYVAIAVARTENNYGCSGSQNCQYVSNVTNKTFQAGSYDSGNGYAGFWWLSIGKAQALPKAHRLKHCYIPTAIQLMFVLRYVGHVIELLVLAIHDVFSNVAPDHDSCAVAIQ